MPKVDFGFISNLEGGQRLTGYVPDANNSQSGVTIATGFDLGARNVSDLRNLGLSQALIEKLTRYLGKQRREAQRILLMSPLRVTKAEADAIDKACKKSALDTLVTRYDRVLPRRAGILRFEQLPAPAQTVIASVAFQYGDLSRRTPKFWRTVTEQRWQAAVEELRDFGDRYGPRRNKEADLLATILNRQQPTTPQPSTPLVATYAFSLFRPWEPQRKTLVGSVGQGGKNKTADVQLIQHLLNEHRPVPLMSLREDGVVDQQLIDAIVDFQRRSVGLSRPDGRVDPGGRTFQVLIGAVQKAAPPKPPPRPPAVTQAARDCCFPLASVPTTSWKTGMRAFGSNRSNGQRKHAACDLYAPEGTWIYAVADGRIIQPPYDFYCETDALEVDHGDFIVRYGEIKKNSFVGGTTVRRGQRLCQVGHLDGITVPSDMLHFEMYAGTASGPLSVNSNPPFRRRNDLLDPTPFLDAWAANLPSA